MRAMQTKRIRKVLTAAGAGQLVADLDLTPFDSAKKIEIKMIQVTTDVNATVDIYFAAAEVVAGDSGNAASFGPGHVPAPSGANIPFLGNGPQNTAPTYRKIRADVVGAVTNCRIYIEYEEF